MKTNKTDYIYSKKDFLKPIFLILALTFFTIFIIAGIYSFSGFIISDSFPLKFRVLLFSIIITGGIIIIFIPQSIFLAIFYLVKMRGSYLIINEREIDLGKRYIGPIDSQDKTILSISKTSPHNSVKLVIPWRDIEKIKVHKICKGIPGSTLDYYYFVIMCKNNTSYLKPINEHIIAKIQKKAKQLNKNFLID